MEESQPNFARAPFVVIWEMTQACDLTCRHCRASAQPERAPGELTTREAEILLAEVRAMQSPVFVLTGGDPLKRPDLFHLVEYGTRLGVRVSLTPSTTPLLTRAALAELQARGLARLAVSLDGADSATHDRFRGVEGTFARAIAAIAWARELGLPVQVNTTVSRHNVAQFEAMAALMGWLDIVLWSVFFLIPTGRGKREDCLDADEVEALFAKLYALSRRARFAVKTTEAMHYRRFVLQQRARERRAGQNTPPQSAREGEWRAPRGLNDGKGFVFVSHRGEVYPSGFLPLSAGNVRRTPLARIYADSPLFLALRDPARLEGKCGMCEFREVCGGSRARAFACTGNAFASDPSCGYVPARWLARGLPMGAA